VPFIPAPILAWLLCIMALSPLILALRCSKSAIIICLMGWILTVHNSQFIYVDQSIQFNPTSNTGCHMLECAYCRGFGLDVGFIDHFKTQLVITLNRSAIANFHTLQITRAHAKSFPASCVVNSSLLVMAPTMAIPLLPCSNPLWMAAPFKQRILAPVVLHITPWHRPS
jgi:hypothetical protein